MLRYIALAWDAENLRDTADANRLTERIRTTSSEWNEALLAEGLRVFYSGSRPGVTDVYRIGQDGVVLGTLFERASSSDHIVSTQVASFGAKESTAIISSAGRRLIESYWGWYVAFLCESQTNRKWVLRGPMSDLPCFRTNYNAVTVCFSRLEDCLRIRMLTFTINWRYIAAHVAFGASARIGDSAINEVSALERGECLAVRGERASVVSYWHPCSVAKSEGFEDPHEAARALRVTTLNCVHSWASRHESILLRLSGGFDSSVVLSCLNSAPTKPRITCVNHYSTGAMGDERRYARTAARHFGSELLERERAHEGTLESIKSVARTTIPILDFADWERHRWEHNEARTRSATAIFTGSLGDVLFERSPRLSPAADYLHRHGIRLPFFRVLLDVAQQRRVSVWHILPRAFCDGMINPPRGTWNSFEARAREAVPGSWPNLLYDDTYVELQRDILSFVHPWLHNVTGVPPGKLWTIAALFVEGFYERHFRGPNDPEVVAPFISQPLAELCLRIPTYLNVTGGWDRAIARRAFEEDLPAEILARTTKGSPSPWLREVVDRNVRFIRDFLLGGLLVSQRVLDPQKLEAALPGAPTKTGCAGGHIMNLLYTEAWARAWSEERHTAAAA